jgi:hypothetical protein
MRSEQVYRIESQADALVIGGALAGLGFVHAYLAGAYGPGCRLGSVVAEFVKSRTDESVTLTLSGPDHELSPILRHLGETPIVPGEMRPIVALMKSQQAIEQEQLATRQRRQVEQAARRVGRQVARENDRMKYSAGWKVRSNDATVVESKLTQAGYQLESGDDGMPVYRFGRDATVAIDSDQQHAGMLAEIRLLARTASALDSARRLIMSGAIQMWPIDARYVEAAPMSRSERNRQDTEQLSKALKAMPPQHRKTIRRALKSFGRERRR